MAELGFLGLGIMGTPMAHNLLKAGHRLQVWNRSPEKAASLEAAGAVACSSPAEVCAAADITFVMLADPAAVRAVHQGPGGTCTGLGGGKGLVDMSTIDPKTSREMAAAVRATGARYLEAPVSGSKKPAEDGTLVILAAGDRDLYDEAGAYLDLMGKLRVHLGEVGQGARMKLVVNMIMGGMMTAFGEGLALSGRCGLDPAVLLEVLAAGALANPMFAGKGPAVTADRFAPAFPLKHMQKDLRLALALGDELGLGLPTAAAANAAFIRARDAGMADLDFSAVCRTLRGEGSGRN
ncbi:MAG: NAD(P)-dependent oxidoreductase [Candidatus Krumholzibacteriia bacterium]